MFVENRDESREFFLRIWAKMANNDAMEPLEALIAQVIVEHPEYHATLDNPDRALAADFDGGDGAPNPFLHMGLHIALVEQLQTDRPSGVRDVYRRLLEGSANGTHTVEHRMMDCLAEALWQAGRNGHAPDENAYLASVQRLL